MSRFIPSLDGFEVITLPPIEERLALPWYHPYAIPRSINESGKPPYKFKLRVFKDTHWYIDVPEIAESRIGGEFNSQEEALAKAWEYLSLRMR